MKPIAKFKSRALFTIVGGSVLINPVFAQEQAQDQAEAVPEVVVTGVRAALESAQSIKLDADTFVDSITATDIGAFPDKSVAEALQRVPGITVSRLQSSDDSNHFSAEPSSVLIRGLTFVRTQFNGRDSFSADGYRGLNFNDVSPELMAGVDSYKNQTAEMIEGGIAGVVNLRTRQPLDSDGQDIVLTGRVNYGSLSQDPTYEASGVYSKTWDTDSGRFGVLLNAAWSNIVTRTESVNMTRIATLCSDYAPGAPAVVGSDGNVVCNTNPFGSAGFRYAPGQVNFSQVDYDRTRTGAALALQYANDDDSLKLTFTAVDSKYENPWLERSSNISWPTGTGFGTPVWAPQGNSQWRPITGSFAFGADGMLDSGVIGQPSSELGFNGANAAASLSHGSAVPGLPFVNANDSCGGVPCITGANVSDEARIFNHEEETRDFSFNVAWDVTEKLHTSFDFQYIKADTRNYDILVAANSLAQVDYSTDSHGTPRIGLSPGPNVNYADGFLANPHNYWMQFIQDHWEHNDADEKAARADVEYDLGSGGWLNSLKAGVRLADREQKVRYSAYNWAPIAPTWGCNGPGFNIDNTTAAPYPADCGNANPFNGYPQGIWESTSLSDHYDGSVFNNGPVVFLNRATLRDYDLHTEGLADRNVNAPQGWNPLCDRTANVDECFTAPEILDVNEKSKAAYVMLRFGGPETNPGGINITGNVGVRYVRTEIESHGQVGFPIANWYNTALAQDQGDCDPSDNTANQATDIQCWLTPALLAYSNGAGRANTLDKVYTNVLPSFNVRFGLTDKQFARFGYSRGMSRPDFGLLRNSVAINAPPIDVSNNSPYLIRGAGGAVTGYNFVFNAEAGYAGLEPVEADNFDLSYEWYISKSSSFTAGVFYKKLENAIAYGRATRDIENNGSTQAVTIRGPSNDPGSGGTLKGIELAYQTFFDFLPGAWSGIGLQVNYTHTKQEDINNSNLAVQAGYLPGSTTAFGGGNNGSTGGNGNAGNPLSFTSNVIDSHSLAGISDDSFNVVGLYEFGKFGARLAYSWRSEFLTANLDCCIGLPVWQKASGYLDGSARFSITDNVELSADVSNILNTTAVTQQQIFGDSTLTPNANPVKIDSGWVRNDRRFQLGVRFKY